jgi:NarL family two-component system response regulator LiaR
VTTGLRLLVVADRASPALVAELTHVRGYQLVGRLASTAVARQAIEERAPDVILVDVPTLDRLSGLAELVDAACGTGVVAVTSVPAEVALLPCMAAGVRAFVARPLESDIVDAALAAAAQGQTYVDPRCTQWLVDFAVFGHRTRRHSGLTLRQSQVVQLVGRGLTNQQIARALGVSVVTVKSHLNDVMRTVGAQDRWEAAAKASGGHAVQAKRRSENLQPARGEAALQEPKEDATGPRRSTSPRGAGAPDARTPRHTDTEDED